MKNLILFLFLFISTGIQAQKMIHELPAKTNVDSTNWLFLTGNPTSGKLYKITAANLRDSIAPATDTTSLSNRINLKLNATDTASLSTRIDLKLNATDTASLSSRIDAISGGGGGGGETLDSTLSLGNQTDETIIFTGPTDDYNFIEVNPIENHADQLVLNFTRWSQPQAGQINNEGLIFGFNINGGGGQIEAGLPALGESWETGYFTGSERWVEKHEIYLKPDATHIRLSSYTINTVTENIGFYHTVNTFQLTDETGPYLFASANAATGASKLQTNAANGTAALSIETNGTDNLVTINSLINTSPSELQFSAFELTTFNDDVKILGAFYDSNSEAGTAGHVLSSTGTGTDWVAPSFTSIPAGSNTHVQYNSSGVMAGSANFTFDGSSATITSSGLSADNTVLTITSSNTSATANLLANVGVLSSMDATTAGGMSAFTTYTVNRGSGAAVGTSGLAYGSLGTGIKIGILGRVVKSATSAIGGYFHLAGDNFDLGWASLSTDAAALVADNGPTTDPIFLAKDNNTTVFNIKDGGIINISNAPTYADDTAAGAGGLVAGDVFKTSAGDLKIKL